MKDLIIKIARILLPDSLKRIGKGYQCIHRHNPQMSIPYVLLHGKLFMPNKNKDYFDDYVRQFNLISDKINVDLSTDYLYPFDTMLLRVFDRQLICSITVDFGKVLNSNLRELSHNLELAKDFSFKSREKDIIASIEKLAIKYSRLLKKTDTPRANILSSYFESMLYRKPQSLDEALQKILFYDALFWQMGHLHIGIGRLDYILIEYYNKDLSDGTLTKKEAKSLLRSFLITIGKDTPAKSAGLIGDTGQYILLGGIDAKGENVDNPLTEIILELMSELKIPDPKLILRVNLSTLDCVWEKAIQCVLTGIGSPLILNEEPVMEKMVRFGYSISDVWNIGTSACWEPLIIGKSFDQNNPFRSAVAMSALNNVILSNEYLPTFESLLSSFKVQYKKVLECVVSDIDFDCSPLFSLFFDDCVKKECDFTDGGSVYAYHGAQVVSLPNTINALLNIKRLVYDEGLYSIDDCRNAILMDFNDMEDFRTLLTTAGLKFGSTASEVVNLTNELIKFTGETVRALKSNGRPIKVGFSSPNYIGEAKNFPASLDGRHKGDPFAVHISPISSKIDISEVLDFSTRLVYSDNCINGNVVDFILPSSYIKQQDKLIGIIKNACHNGVFEIQLNVMDKATLIDAKAHPEKYPNLVVRVWGFSAYFNDLPEEYKDNLIRRAEVYETA